MRRRRGITEIAELKIAGEDVRVWFHPEDNEFRASLLDEDFVDADYRKLVARLKKKGKEYKPTISIPITKVEHGEKGCEFTDITVTGVHSGNRNIMARNDATGEIIQLSRGEFADYDRDKAGSDRWFYRDSTPKYVRRLTDAERAELHELTIHAHKAEKARDAAQRRFKIAVMAEIKRLQKQEAARMKEAVADDELEGDPRLTSKARR